MPRFLVPLVLLFAPACGATRSTAEVLDAHRVEIYELVDAVRPLSNQLAANLIELLTGLEVLADAIDAADASD